MSTRIYFLAPFSNFYSEVSLHFKSGLKTANVRLDKAATLVSKLEGLDEVQAINKLVQTYQCTHSAKPGLTRVDEQTASFLTGSVLMPITFKASEVHHRIIMPPAEVTKNASDTVSRMRLFKEGSIRTIVYFFYIKLKGELHSLPRYSSVPVRFERHTTSPYTISRQEVPRFHNFLKQVKIPFGLSYLDLCFENFSLSYDIANNFLAFLSLVTALEVLFNDGRGEITHKLSRRLAALLAKNGKEFDEIFSDMKKIYDKRSNSVHEGSGKNITSDDVLHVREYVRRAIIAASRINKGKEEFLKILDRIGFDKIQNHA